MADKSSVSRPTLPPSLTVKANYGSFQQRCSVEIRRATSVGGIWPRNFQIHVALLGTNIANHFASHRKYNPPRIYQLVAALVEKASLFALMNNMFDIQNQNIMNRTNPVQTSMMHCLILKTLTD